MRVQAAIRRSVPNILALLLIATLCGLGLWMWTLQRNWAFVSAAETGNVAQVRAALDRGFGPDTVSRIGGITALRMAIYGGHADVVRLLLDRGADATGGLDQAIRKGDPSMVRLLITRGAKVNARDAAGGPPLRVADGAGNKVIIRLLKAAGARE